MLYSNISGELLITDPKGALAGVGQGSRVNSCEIANSLPTGLERQVGASKESRGELTGKNR